MSGCILENRGYSCEVEVRHPYRGNGGYCTVIRASKNGSRYIVFKAPFWQVDHYLRHIQGQGSVAMAAKLSHLAGSVFLAEECAGVLVWENEDNSQFVDKLPVALEQLVDSLGRIGLVHGDIRPWNIFYDHSTQRFAIIDWGFSFFMDEGIAAPPYWHLRDHLRARGHDISSPQAIDRVDARKTLDVVRGRLRYEDAWHHQPEEMQWRPPWAAR